MCYHKPTVSKKSNRCNAICKEPKETNDCLEAIANKINEDVENQLHKAFYGPYSEISLIKSNTVQQIKSDQDWVNVIKSILDSEDPKYPGAYQCLIAHNCYQYIKCRT